jgi:hypothetical protein
MDESGYFKFKSRAAPVVKKKQGKVIHSLYGSGFPLDTPRVKPKDYKLPLVSLANLISQIPLVRVVRKEKRAVRKQAPPLNPNRVKNGLSSPTQ